MSSDPVIIVSADGHIGPRPETYRDYLERRFWDDLERLMDEDTRWTNLAWEDEAAIEAVDDRGAIRAGGRSGAYDLQRRLKELDADGVAAEVVRHGHQLAVTLWYGSTNMQPYSSELRNAGSRAYNRWAADALTDCGGRIRGVAEPGPCLDMDATIREIEWAAEQGFVAVEAPGVVADPLLPPLYDSYYEPFWDACESSGLPMNIHAGHGSVQGHNIGRLMEIDEFGEKVFSDEILSRGRALVRRMFWQLILGGVFDRHPELKLVFTETRATWIPGLLAYLDERLAHSSLRTERTPRDYFRQHCMVTPSSIRESEVAMRQAIGVERMMFGVDYPHPEGTWPNTADWVRATFGYQGVPEVEARLILGGNAVEFFGLDHQHLRTVAGRIGPRPDELFRPGHTVDPRKIEHFHKRSGFLKPMDDPMGWSLPALLEEDLRATSHVSAD
jgi:predicted TIM-barrel fold metal-dependent hydrolase